MRSIFVYIFMVVLLAVSCTGGDKQSSVDQHDDSSVAVQVVDTSAEVLLPDADGQSRSVEQMKGSVVLMDVLYEVPSANDKHIERLREVYEKYSAHGLQIYQVCMSQDADAWRIYAKSLPWTAVYDDNTLQSSLLVKYHVVNIPSTQLFDRDGRCINKSLASADMDKAVESVIDADGEE